MRQSPQRPGVPAPSPSAAVRSQEKRWNHGGFRHEREWACSRAAISPISARARPALLSVSAGCCTGGVFEQDGVAGRSAGSGRPEARHRFAVRSRQPPRSAHDAPGAQGGRPGQLARQRLAVVIAGPVQPKHGRLIGATVAHEIGGVLRDAEQLEVGVVAVAPMRCRLAGCGRAEDGIAPTFRVCS